MPVPGHYIRRILNSLLDFTGSQCREADIGEICFQLESLHRLIGAV